MIGSLISIETVWYRGPGGKGKGGLGRRANYFLENVFFSEEKNQKTFNSEQA
jgi:hypothetical protein